MGATTASLPARTVRAAVNAAFHAYARRRTATLAAADPVAVQEQTLRLLLRRAEETRFGRDHRFAGIHTVGEF